MESRQYLRVHNWDKFQHYSGRRPPWVKFHVELLDDYDLMNLPIAAQLVYDRMLLVAARLDNSVENDPKFVGSLLHLPTKVVAPALRTLIDSGFLEVYDKQDASNALANLYARDREELSTSEEETETEELDLAAAPPTRVERDSIWDALDAIFGAPLTRSAKTLRGKIVTSLLEAGATVEQISAAPDAYRARMPGGTTLTETALEKHWSLLLVPVENVKPTGPNMKYGRRDVSSGELLAWADRLESERLAADEGRQLAPG